MTFPTFKPLDEYPVAALNLTVQSFVHKVTGAEHYHLKCDNPENVFMVGLRTAPTDSTGVAHILEHTVLCGSRNFPVRDPFFMMLRRSLNTFMNAFTSSDWTAYPFASQNRKDFFNLLDVYLDAVFFPRLDELDFAQEGHRLEFTDPTDSASPLIFKGVVYNEMQGAMITPVSFLWQALSQHLFPNTTYHFNSGGDPEIIPSLTHARLKEFHRRNYHPSNAFFLTYGDLPAAELQEVFETRVLHEFQAELGAPFLVAPEIRLQAPVVVCESYPAEALPETETEDQRTHLVMGWLLESDSSLESLIEAHLLAAVLLDNSSSPLLDALETTTLGRAPSPLCGLDDDHKELIFCCGLEGCKADSAAEIEDLILTTLNRVADAGLPFEQVEAVLHQLELQRREIGGDGYPYGLQLLLAAFPAIVHKGSVVDRLDIDPVLIKLREKIKDPAYLGKLIRRLLLDNRHRVRLAMVPDSELGPRREKALTARLQARLRALDEPQRQEIINRAATLSQRQQEQDDPEILPKVGLEDVPDKLPIPSAKATAPKLPLTYFPAGTNGLVYQQVIFDLPDLDDEALDILPDYSACLTELGCNGLDYRQTQAWQARVSGGIGAYYKVRGGIDDNSRVKGMFVLSGRALQRNHSALTELLRKTLETIRFDEVEHIREIMAQSLAHQEQQVTASGHLLAMRAAASGCGPVAALGHRVHGLEGLQKLKKLYLDLSQDEAALAAFSHRFELIHEQIITAPRQFLLVSEDEHSLKLSEELEQGWQGSLLSPDPKFRDFTLDSKNHLVRQAWTTDTTVNFCAKAYPTVTIAHPDAAPLAVLGGFLRNGYLHRAIREEGGAYGGGAGHDPGGAAFRFYSYRDPRFQGTLDDFDRSLDWLQENKHEARQVEEAILGVVSQIDKPGSPAGRAKQAFFDGLYGRDAEFLRTYRRQVLAVTLKDLQRVAVSYLNPENANIAVLTDSVTAGREAAGLGLEVVEL